MEVGLGTGSDTYQMAYAEVEFRCFVGGLESTTPADTLEDVFSEYGEILESKIIKDRESGRSRGFGFVTFRDERAMRNAIKGLNGHNIDGRNITVNEAQSRGSGGDFDMWKEGIESKDKLHVAANNCCKFEFPIAAGRVPDAMRCPECHRVMEKHIAFVCCHDKDGLLELD